MIILLMSFRSSKDTIKDTTTFRSSEKKSNNIDMFKSVFNEQTPKKYVHVAKKIQKVIESEDSITIDPRRNVNNKEKLQIWNSCQFDKNFDKDYFRIDILGNLCIKNIKYNNNYNDSKKFAFEYEHFVSYSNGGKSNTTNVCLLNAGINRSKSNNAVYTLTFNENHGLCRRYAISASELYSQLKYDLHEACKKYNIYFKKVADIWTIIDYSYNDQNITLWKNPDSPLHSKSKVKSFIQKNDLYEDNSVNIGIISGVASGISMLLAGLFIGHNVSK